MATYTETLVMPWDQSMNKGLVAELWLCSLVLLAVLILELIMDKVWVSPQAEHLGGLESAPANLGGHQDPKYAISGIDENGPMRNQQIENLELQSADPKDINVASQIKKDFDGDENMEENHADHLPDDINLPVPLQPNVPEHAIEKGALDKETYTMYLREEMFYHFMYHAISVGYCIVTWQNGFIMAMAWIHFCLITAYVVLRVLDKPWAKWLLIGTCGINLIMIICAMANWNQSAA